MKPLGTAAFYVLSLGVAAYAIVAYGVMPSGTLVPPEMGQGFHAHRSGLTTHVFASLAAVSLSPFLFSARLRRARPWLHRLLGRA